MELPVAVRAGVGGDLLAVDAQREMQIVQEACDCTRGDRKARFRKSRGDILRGLAGPLQSGDRISGGIVLEQSLDGSDYFGRFFFTGLRPPPVLRARSTCTS